MIKEEFVNELREGGQDASASKERLWNVSQEERARLWASRRPLLTSWVEAGAGGQPSFLPSLYRGPFLRKGRSSPVQSYLRTPPWPGFLLPGWHPALAPLRCARPLGSRRGRWEAGSWPRVGGFAHKNGFSQPRILGSLEDLCLKGTGHLRFSLLSARHMHRCHKVLIPASFIAPSLMPPIPRGEGKGGGTQRESLLARSGRLGDIASQGLRSL